MATKLRRTASHSLEMSEVKDENESDTEFDSDGGSEIKEVESNFANSKLYMIVYLMLYCVLGSSDSGDASIWTNIQRQLNTSTYIMGWIYASGTIVMIPGSLISGYVTDKYIETHRFAAINLGLIIITDCLVPFTQNVIIMFILFILSGFAVAAVDTCSGVFIFRLYPENGAKMYFLFDTCRDIISTITPLIFDWSISQTGEYSYPIFAGSAITFIVMIFILFLPTPQHDKLRTIKRDIAEKMKKKTMQKMSTIEETEAFKQPHFNEEKLTEKAAKAKKDLKQHPQYRQTQYLIIIIFIIIMFFYAAFSEGTGVFILLYCEDYLGVNERVGRYLLSVFDGANVLYRFIDLSLVVICKIELNVLCFIYFANIVQLIAVVVWIFFDDTIAVLFVVYAICGFFGSLTYPGICELIENLRPITGYLSCMLGIAFFGGDAIFTIVTAALFTIFSTGIYPIVLAVLLIAMVIFTCINLLLYGKYDRIKAQTISYQNDL